jgi:aryl-alcohol dehydrogenase-like predicted oxidoreductase
MRRVTLHGTDITTTALAFGTSTLLGRLSKKESLRLLAVAYENGIRHFDTAPLYGYGESEGLLGEFIRKRPDVTVATKFGQLRPRANSFLFRQVKQIGRPLLRAFPQLRAGARQVVHEGFRDVANFDPVAAEVSLRASLKKLGREQIDLFFLHECRQGDLADERLLTFLVQARTRGLVRAFGIATDIDTIAYARATVPAYTPVIQFPNNPNEPNLERTPELGSAHACITHSPFGGFGKNNPVDLASALRYATEQNPRGIVLFSSQNPAHIVGNIKSFDVPAPESTPDASPS